MDDENTEVKLVKKSFIAEGTTCESCAKIIMKQAEKVDGVKDVSFNYVDETGYVTYDPAKTDLDKILNSIEEKGYDCYVLDGSPAEDRNSTPTKNYSKTLAWGLGLLGIILALYFIINMTEGIELPTISQNMGYGLLFIVGLLTGFHCIAMCGGFVVSYTTKDAQANKRSHRSHLMYGIGKTLSYTIIGAIFGLIGSLIAFTPMIRGIAGLLAGLFLVLFGLKMINIFPALRKIQFRTPGFINRFVGKNQSSSPLVIGLLNGLMIACGPLQAIYIMAAGTGSPLEGAKLLFIFALGTLPVMLGFGLLTSIISNKMTAKILKASGIIVIILGVIMMDRGLALTGSGYDFRTITGKVIDVDHLTSGSAEESVPLLNSDGYQEIHMTVDRYGWTPDKFVLKKDVPVRWIIDGKEITGCNKAIQVPKLGLEFDIKKGEQVIEFTPTEEGTIPWSCWMGMIPGTFIIKDGINLDDASVVQEELDNVQQAPSGSCGGSCGSPTCDAATGGSCGCDG